ncbi:MAG TPA: efflux RND transporter periplasmic adaptor subunit [Vicinamibacterales bacterium]|nr:efflux RND transporter periplasmic adaptor subunit [Vicinamibacterales bacterium]
MPVVTAVATSRAVPVTIDAVGTAEAFTTVQLRSQITGQLSDVHFSEGQDVRKGQLLFSIDARPFQASLQQAQAVLAKDAAQAKNSQAEATRYADLYKRGLLPRDQYEAQEASNASLQETLNADKAAVEQAKLNLEYTRIVSPIDGRTGALMVHVGDLIRANDTNPMVVINKLSPIYVTFSVPGRFLNDIRHYQGQKALKVQAWSPSTTLPGSQAPPPSSESPDVEGAATGPHSVGTVSFIDNAIDPTTGTIKLKGTFANTNHSLWPGLFVQVTLLLTTQTHAIVIPSGAVQNSQQGTYVYVVKPDHTVEYRSVTVQRQQGEDSIIARGVTPGETVVTDGQLRLTPGAKVNPRPAAASDASLADPPVGTATSGSGTPRPGRRGHRSGSAS